MSNLNIKSSNQILKSKHQIKTSNPIKSSNQIIKSIHQINSQVTIKVGSRKVWLSAQKKSCVSSLEENAQFLKKLFYLNRFLASRFSGHTAVNSHDLGLCILMPTPQSLHRKRDEVDGDCATILKGLAQFPVSGKVKGISWFDGGSFHACHLEWGDDHDFKGCVPTLTP